MIESLLSLEHKENLRKLRCYSKFIKNLKARFNHDKIHCTKENFKKHIIAITQDLNSRPTTGKHSLLTGAFAWDYTPEGGIFWLELARIEIVVK